MTLSRKSLVVPVVPLRPCDAVALLQKACLHQERRLKVGWDTRTAVGVLMNFVTNSSATHRFHG